MFALATPYLPICACRGEDPMRQGHTDAYDGSWFEDVKKIGAENYYPPIVP